KIQLTNTSDGMNPIMPSKEKKDTDKPEIKSGGVDQFISEFKQEMEQLTPESDKSLDSSKSEKIEPAPEIELDINQLTDFIAQKIVDQLMAKINKEEISRIIKEFLPQLKNSKNRQ
ncbi:MAG: hypothetical protein GY865_12640, partial [candidate division Zixibacteria bacterium]|nr:hypothetical protein [candidate division Zixibacteria bacterium]